LLVVVLLLLDLVLFPFTSLNSPTTANAAPHEKSYFHNIIPARLYDSRNCPGNGNNAPLGRDGYYYNGTSRSFLARGYVGIPQTATAIFANVTVSTQRIGDCSPSGAAYGSGSITVYPRFASDLGAIAVKWWNAGPWTIPNHDFIGLDSNGYFTITSRGTADVIIDVYGYIDTNPSSGGLYRSAYGRIYDSRTNSGYQGSGLGRLYKFNANNTNIRTVQVTGFAGIPSYATAVIINLTAGDSNYGGYLIAYPYGYSSPNTSSTNWNDRYTPNSNITWDVPNMAVVPLNDGKISITVGGNNYWAGAETIVDVMGYIVPSSYGGDGYFGYLPTPTQLFDTGSGQLTAGESQVIQVTSQFVPAGAIAAIVHLTVKNASAGGGYFAMYPSNVNHPGNSNVNTNNNNLSGQEPGNLAIIPLSSEGKLTVLNSVIGSSKGFKLDVVGYILANQPLQTVLPFGMNSYYVSPNYNPDNLFNLGCQHGTVDNKRGAVDSAVILAFGGTAKRESDQVWGTRLPDGNVFTQLTTPNSNNQTRDVKTLARRFGEGYAACVRNPPFPYQGQPNYSARLRLFVGTSNSGVEVNYSHGYAWGQMINELYSFFLSEAQVYIYSANDIELDFDNYPNTRNWLSGFYDASYVDLYNFGDAKGCPTGGNPAVNQLCGGNLGAWYQDQVIEVSYRPSEYTYVIPQIYTNSLANAKQWDQWLQLSRRYNYTSSGGIMQIKGVLTQAGACKNPARFSQCVETNNTPEQGYLGLSTALRSRTETSNYSPFLPYLTDICWMSEISSNYCYYRRNP
jgi:hypothetical protein